MLRWLPTPLVSIHAPARGATQLSNCSLWDGVRFQSTLPRGERRCAMSLCYLDGLVSIHAPARGATTHTTTINVMSLLFQSTLPRGERPGQDAIPDNRIMVFQSTLPRGERL